MDKQVDFLVKLRDGCQMIADAANEYLENFAPRETRETATSETTFSCLKFEAQHGEKIGDFEVAYQANNPREKWNNANDILSQSKATIKERYHDKGYAYAYWVYGEGRIYRQTLRGAAAKP